MTRSERFLHRYLFGTPLTTMLFGGIFTILVQSSSITTSIVVPLIGSGILTLPQIFPYVLGANIGTTVTAMLASLATGNLAAVTVAFTHLSFNLSGILLIYPIPAIRHIPMSMASGLAALTGKSRLIPIAYVVLVFYLIPLLLIFLWR